MNFHSAIRPWAFPFIIFMQQQQHLDADKDVDDVNWCCHWFSSAAAAVVILLSLSLQLIHRIISSLLPKRVALSLSLTVAVAVGYCLVLISKRKFLFNNNRLENDRSELRITGDCKSGRGRRQQKSGKSLCVFFGFCTSACALCANVFSIWRLQHSIYLHILTNMFEPTLQKQNGPAQCSHSTKVWARKMFAVNTFPTFYIFTLTSFLNVNYLFGKPLLVRITIMYDGNFTMNSIRLIYCVALNGWRRR